MRRRCAFGNITLKIWLQQTNITKQEAKSPLRQKEKKGKFQCGPPEVFARYKRGDNETLYPSLSSSTLLPVLSKHGYHSLLGQLKAITNYLWRKL